MKLWAGTSGYSYKEWKGYFYPEDLSAGEMLSFYAKHLPAVEINNTFYRLPRKNVVEAWGEQVPEGFRFSIKASRRITHMRRIKNAESETEYLLETVRVLGDRLGVLFFQLPPFLKKDVPRLAAFLGSIPEGVRVAFEFRHDSWADPEVHACLGERGAALCISDTDEAPTPDLVRTADWGYLRLRKPEYTDEEMTAWLARIRETGWEEAFVFFKHEEDGAGPEMAGRLLSAFRA